MATMIDSLRDLASPAVVSALSQHTAETESAVSRGLGAAIPAIASTIANRADDQGFVKNLADLATTIAAGPDPLESARSLASSPMGVDTTNPIGGWLSSLFGRNLTDVTGNVARYAGISGSSAAALFSIAAPLVLRYLGRLMRSESLTSGGLAYLLREQRAQLASSLPSGFTMPGVTEPYEMAPVAVKKSPSIGWSMPLAALLTVLGIGGLLWWARDKPIEVAQVTTVEQPSKPVGTTGTLPGTLPRTVPGNVTPTIPSVGSAEYRLSTYLASAVPGSTTVSFDRIAFESDSAVLTAESSEQLRDIATILRAYPRASVTVAGHTDSVGSEAANEALSRARADTVAARLTADGMPSDRVRAEGYGSQKPVADNSTEAGRAQNRRVELEVSVR
jgi:outer membrane protein OmpA-like peptidoglycan-associated protein